MRVDFYTVQLVEILPATHLFSFLQSLSSNYIANRASMSMLTFAVYPSVPVLTNAFVALESLYAFTSMFTWVWGAKHFLCKKL